MPKRKASKSPLASPSLGIQKRRVAASGSSPPSSDDEEEEDYVPMNQSQRPDFTHPTEADVGIVEKVLLRNFMCHNRLEINFGPNVNFVVGHNGSGKSAVVTALVVGLGGKASATSRGSKLKSFIKIGKHSADVEITLRNRGSDSYKPDLYGDKIIVQRHFNKDGSSQYKLKSKEGRVVSQKKDDLVRLLDEFNIQVDNPVAILNQDTSRNFLNSKSANDKYKFFLKATQLEQIRRDYATANEQKVVTVDVIEQKIKTLPNLEKEVLDWEQKYKSLTALDDLKGKIKKLKNELAWAFVIEKEKGMSPLQKELTHEEARTPRFSQKVKEAKAKLDTVTNHMKELTDKLNSSGEEVKKLQPDLENAKTALGEQKKSHRIALNDVKRLESALRNNTREQDSICQRIKELRTSAEHDYEAERAERLRKIEALEEKLVCLTAQEKTTDHQLDQFRSAITKYKNDKYKVTQDAHACQTQHEKLQRNLQTLKASQGNKLKRFGGFMPAVIQRVDEYERQGRFHKRPLGPVGANFSLREQKWALAVECCLKGLMNAFCCHDYHDEKILEQIFRDSCPPNFKPTIIVSKFKDSIYDTSRFRAQSDQYPTIIDVIESSDPMVYNTLIDQRTAECVLLIETGQEARNVMDPDSRPGPPRNAREAFTLEGDQVYTSPTFRYYSSNQDKAKLLTTNVQADIQAAQAELNELNKAMGQLQQQKVQIDSDIQVNVREERKSETQLMKIRESHRKTSMEVGELKNVEDPTPVDVSTLEEEVAVLETKIADQQASLAEKRTVDNDQGATLRETDKTYHDIQDQLMQKLKAGDEIKHEVANVVNEVETYKGHKKHYEGQLKEHDNKVAALRTNLDKYRQEVEQDTEKAVQIHSERIKTRRSPTNLESEITQTNKQIQNEERQRGDPDEIARQYKEKRDKYFSILKDVDQLKHFCRQLDKVVGQRLQQFAEFRRMIAMRAKYFFVVLLSNRQYVGKMTFNHQKETLEMNVQPSKMGEGEGAKDMRALSGGERSFSTVCFILALWDAMESPFRCLDEFDVFMDMVNRKISMDMMLETAKSQMERQFIFLSPLDMSQLGIAGGAKLRIFRMPDPDRGQPALPFRPANQQEGDDED